MTEDKIERYRKAHEKVSRLEADLRALLASNEFTKRRHLIPQWSKACRERNKAERKLLREIENEKAH